MNPKLSFKWWAILTHVCVGDFDTWTNRSVPRVSKKGFIAAPFSTSLAKSGLIWLEFSIRLIPKPINTFNIIVKFLPASRDNQGQAGSVAFNSTKKTSQQSDRLCAFIAKSPSPSRIVASSSSFPSVVVLLCTRHWLLRYWWGDPQRKQHSKQKANTLCARLKRGKKKQKATSQLPDDDDNDVDGDGCWRWVCKE